MCKVILQTRSGCIKFVDFKTFRDFAKRFPNLKVKDITKGDVING